MKNCLQNNRTKNLFNIYIVPHFSPSNKHKKRARIFLALFPKNTTLQVDSIMAFGHCQKTI